MKRRNSFFLSVALCAIFLPLALNAGVPSLINYQGRLTNDLTGKPVVDTLYEITFRIYDDSILSTNLFWSEVNIVKTKQGLFSIILGKNDPVPDTVFSGAVRYLGIDILGQGEVLPRKQIVSTPYAYQALSSDTAQHALTIADNSVTDAKIDDGSISFADIGINAATTGQVMKWDVNSWVARDDETGVNVSDTIVTITLFPFQNLFRFYTQVVGDADVSLFTVPAGRTLYITGVWIASDLNGGSDGAVYIVGSNTLLFFQTTYPNFPLYSWSSGGGAPFEVLAGQTVNLDKNGSTTFVNVTITGFLF